MSSRNWPGDDDEPKTRADYRREQEASDREREFSKRDRQRLADDRKFAREHPAEEPDEQDPTPETPLTTSDFKQLRLKRRLNWAIFWLVLGIVATFVILRYVEF